MAMQPMALYGLEVPCGDVPMMAHGDFPSAFRVTMAAIDPTAEPERDEEDQVPRATLKVLRLPIGAEDEDDDDDEDGLDDLAIEDMERQFGDSDDSEEDDDDEEGVNGGPSDPAKSKQAQREAAQKEIKKLLEEEGMDVDDDDVPNGVNGIIKSNKAKGKMPASDSDEDEDEDDLDPEDLDAEIEEFVICTLDPNKTYQQPLDITFGEHERVWFKVSGTHTIYLTGNYVEPADGDSRLYDPDSDEEDEYDLSPDEDELDEDEDESMDELDDLEDPRITEIDEDIDEVPVLVKTNRIEAKPKNKRPAPESADEDEDEAGAGAQTLDEMIAKEAKIVEPTVNGEPKLSKKQLKKLKKNDGAAASAPVIETVVTEKKEIDAPSSTTKADKKVSFAKELEQGPTPTKDKATDKNGDKPATPSLGVKVVQGVTIDDRKLGSGQAAKKGDRVSMRYIGKLKDGGKVFDSNKGGKPFKFKLGAAEVIEGWEIGVKGMQAGGERRITVPPGLAYKNKKLPDIPPNSTLQFDIKLLDISKGN